MGKLGRIAAACGAVGAGVVLSATGASADEGSWKMTSVGYDYYGSAGDDFAKGKHWVYSAPLGLQTKGRWLGDNKMWGFHGDDELWGQGGVDRLYGGAGEDVLFADHPTVDDTVEGGDALYGGPGYDALTGSEMWDIIYGGADKDSVVARGGDDQIFVHDPDNVWCGLGKDLVVIYGYSKNAKGMYIASGCETVIDNQ